MPTAARMTAVTTARWLEGDEVRLWRAFIEVASVLLADLDGELQADHGLTLGDYEVLVVLSEAPGHAMRMCDLAERLRLSPSGLTRRLDGLVRDQVVRRMPAPDDRRVNLAQLTDHGFERLAAAAPDHVAGVRRHMLDHLTDGQITLLADSFTALLAARQAERAQRAADETPRRR